MSDLHLVRRLWYVPPPLRAGGRAGGLLDLVLDFLAGMADAEGVEPTVY